MPTKYYAVKHGKTPGIYTSWDDCKRQVHGYPNATYKSFTSLDLANDFMNIQTSSINDSSTSIDSLSATESFIPAMLSDKKAIAYVDGSYNSATKEYSYGIVFITNAGEFHFYEGFNDPESASMRNVAGEILGAKNAMRHAIEKGFEEIDIYHDYEGISKWCLGLWKANKPGTIKYREYYLSIKDKLKVNFIKVKGHSNDKYNDLADELAKKAIF